MKLTPRQRDVVALLDAGLTCQKIAERLGIAVKTVRRHVEDVDSLLHDAGLWDGDSVPLKRIRKHAATLLTA